MAESIIFKHADVDSLTVALADNIAKRIEPMLVARQRRLVDRPTMAELANIGSWAVDYFGAKCVVASITPAKFVSWMTWMVHCDEGEERKTLSPSSAKKHAKRLRQILAMVLALGYSMRM